jgi:hypothetical protein
LRQKPNIPTNLNLKKMRHLQKTQYYILQIFLLIIVGFSGCKSVEEPEGEIVISTLKIEAIKNNSVLSNDLIGD